MSGVGEMTRFWGTHAALAKSLRPGILTDFAAIQDRLRLRPQMGGVFETSLRTNNVFSGVPTDHLRLRGLTELARLQQSLGSVRAHSATERLLAASAKYSLLESSLVGRSFLPGRFDTLRAIAAGAQSVAWMEPLLPAMLSLTELAEEDLQEEDRLARLRSIVASVLASAPRHLNFDRLFAIFAFIWSLLPNGQIQELSEQMKEEFRQLREEIRENRVAAELDAEQLRELQIQVLLATEGIESGYVATIETTARIKTRRSGRASVLGTLSPGEPVIVLLLRGRWAYIEAELGTRHVVGWIPKKALSKPRKALLPDLEEAESLGDRE
ncbi:MAG: hypothetical protein B6A08_15465 [Sorangiineae bacterium NIC37A_2]|nr:MAG: hypothetical protein B6A08_15465 [Sorangiineae bacterium NIC37A_2]